MTPAGTSRESDLELPRKVVGKHSIFSLPKRPKYAREPKMTRAPCRKRTGDAAPRTENFGDLIAAGHKVLDGGCESRKNHRYAVVVQDLVTQRVQFYPCRTKTSQETERSLRKCLELSEKPNVIYTDNSLEFGKSFGDLSRDHRTSTHHRSETNGIAERAVRRKKKGRLLYCCNLAWTKNGWLILWKPVVICEMFKASYRMGKHLVNGDVENHGKGQ